MHENNPIIGVVSLPLNEIFFKNKVSMFSDSLPLVGGIGFGKLRLRLLWRSVQLTLPKELRGWNVGTVEVGKEGVKVIKWFKEDVKPEWEGCRLGFRTTYGKAKMLPTSSRRAHAGTGTDDEGDDIKAKADWMQKRGRAVHLAVVKRYETCVTLEVHKRAVGPDRTMAFGTVWLKDVRDDEDGYMEVDMWRFSKRSSDTQGDDEKEENHASSGGILSSLNPISNSSSERNSNLINYVQSNVCLERDMEIQGAEKVCRVRFPIKFWTGMSGYHKKVAKNDVSGNLKDVMEVLDYVQGEEEGRIGGDRDDGASSSSLSSSSSDSDSDDDAGAGQDAHKGPVQTLAHTKDSLVGEAKSFKKHQTELQRKHRGLMQWKAARNVAWLGKEVERKAERATEKVKNKITGKADPDKVAGVEKEV